MVLNPSGSWGSRDLSGLDPSGSQDLGILDPPVGGDLQILGVSGSWPSGILGFRISGSWPSGVWGSGIWGGPGLDQTPEGSGSYLYPYINFHARAW